MAFLQNVLKISVPGVSVTTSGTSTTIAIPNNAAGTPARILRISCPNSTAFAYVMPGTSSVTAAANCIAIGGFGDIQLDVTGCTHIAYIQGSANAVLNIAPVEA
jgi:hypothetical protein